MDECVVPPCGGGDCVPDGMLFRFQEERHASNTPPISRAQRKPLIGPTAQPTGTRPGATYEAATAPPSTRVTNCTPSDTGEEQPHDGEACRGALLDSTTIQLLKPPCEKNKKGRQRLPLRVQIRFAVSSHAQRSCSHAAVFIVRCSFPRYKREERRTFENGNGTSGGEIEESRAILCCALG
ncbi:hypothetical protein NDU88_002941 [Pleurodeles waltl]|uniref:Uncharacterized protein n=1 Tax=Pleurodeles waltl TaxID=8319 RepID=A0AAV7LFI1_PLEWA|nr:hypothetical protein NDU88_002941 [Pleurodeles waltl]